MEALARLQLLLEFHQTKLGLQFETPHGLGRTAGGLVTARSSGSTRACSFGSPRWPTARAGALTQWALYGVALGAFHASEFLLAAITGPTSSTTTRC